MGRATWGTTNLKIRDTLYNSCYRAQAGVSPYNFSQSDYIRSSVDPFLYFGNSGSTNSNFGTYVYNKGYVYKDHFIFEKKKLNDFAIFIGANEEVAEKKLIAFSNHLKKHRTPAYEEIQKILKDEERHAEYSLKFAKKNNSRFSYKTKLIKEKTLSFFRHLYANSLNKFSFIFYPILIILIILISFVAHFLKLKKNITDEDVMKNIKPNSII